MSRVQHLDLGGPQTLAVAGHFPHLPPTPPSSGMDLTAFLERERAPQKQKFPEVNRYGGDGSSYWSTHSPNRGETP